MVTATRSPRLDPFAMHRRLSNAPEPSWLAGLRARALAAFDQAGFPDPREEAWRFTRLKRLQKTAFAPSPRAAGEPDLPREPMFASPAHRRVFVNGTYAPHLSDTGTEPGFRVESLNDIWKDADSPALGGLGDVLDLERHRFGALNTAFMNDGALIRVGAGVRVEKPVHLVFASCPGKEPTASFPRVLVQAEAGSEITILEEYLGDPEAVTFTGAVTEIVAHPDASVTHVRLEREGAKAFHIGALSADLARDARLFSHSLTMGGKLVRVDIDARLGAEGAECALDGLYLADEKQHVDHHTWINHARPHTTSREHYKGVLGGAATGVFNGRVIIQPKAQKVVAAQTNNNLLLSRDALVNTNPELEISADDVKAQHGATIGQLDEEHLFYLRSRGLDEARARRLLIQAFAGEMIDRVPLPELRESLSSLVNERF